MKYATLGRTGMKVSRLCLGTMNFGVETDEKESFAIMDAAVDAGINFFDTANVYGRENPGRTEEIIGRWFAQGGGRREKVILATKVFGKMNEENEGPNNERGLSTYKIRRHLEASLKRLQTDHIDLYQMHHIARNVSWDELWGTFEREVNAGKIDYIGSSNFAGWHLVKAQAAAQARHFLGLVSEQHKFSLLNRLPELEVLPAAEDLGIGVIAWSPLDGGLLGGSALTSSPGKRTARNQEGIEKHRSKLEAFSALCKEIGEKEADVALAWTLTRPGMTGPIIGPRSIEQLENTLRVTEIELSDEVLVKLDDIFPGPGGRAPEAYAW
ncbi:aldo/keto reductase [Aureibacillus halotolerans]|uniref:Aryl-alcohol dehydrogenase-like predicted oxidoreductase n=1 Tax=Aureibacillus halotolerans TaxID=1508390 RepID=A0A4R6U5Q5_9BACI|nr:aldo/keto reductase [Aureibacillus halotolerans]TDQ41086.1 aryl-alcohol dehydrogenase-like predicted oxidoreductase [Aureibacillus halotolerans]